MKLECRVKIDKVMLSLGTGRPQLSAVGSIHPLAHSENTTDFSTRADLDMKDPIVAEFLKLVQAHFDGVVEDESKNVEAAIEKRTAETSKADLEESGEV